MTVIHFLHVGAFVYSFTAHKGRKTGKEERQAYKEKEREKKQMGILNLGLCMCVLEKGSLLFSLSRSLA